MGGRSRSTLELTPELRRKIAVLHRSGWKTSALATRFDRSQSYIRLIIIQEREKMMIEEELVRRMATEEGAQHVTATDQG